MSTPSRIWCGSPLDEQVVLEGGRLGLVPVDHEVGERILAQHRPLAPGREAGAAPSEQAGRIDLGRDGLGRHGQRLAQALVAAGGEVTLQRVRVLVAEARGDDLGGVGEGHQALASPDAARAGAGGLGLGHLRPLGDDGGRVGLQADTAPHAHQGAVPHRLGEDTRTQITEQGVEGLRRLRADVAVVDLHAGGAVAVGQALGLVEGEDAVDGRPPGTDPQHRLGVLEQVERAAEQAGDVGAHRQHEGADGLGVQHVIEAGGAAYLRRGHAAQLGDLGHGLGAQPAVLLLGQVAQRDERGTRLGVERHELLCPLADVLVEVAHRSTSPMTGSTEEITATASAMRPPRSSSGRACRLTKLGPRMWRRYGFDVPSETR